MARKLSPVEQSERTGVFIRVPADMCERLDRYAALRFTARTSVVLQALDLFLRANSSEIDSIDTATDSETQRVA